MHKSQPFHFEDDGFRTLNERDYYDKVKTFEGVEEALADVRERLSHHGNVADRYSHGAHLMGMTKMAEDLGRIYDDLQGALSIFSLIRSQASSDALRASERSLLGILAVSLGDRVLAEKITGTDESEPLSVAAEGYGAIARVITGESPGLRTDMGEAK